VDLWHHRTRDGRSLRRALDFLVPYAAGTRPWPYRQITGFKPDALHWLMRRAAVAWRDPAYRTLATQAGGGNARVELTVE
jgi:hypothetical protein